MGIWILSFFALSVISVTGASPVKNVKLPAQAKGKAAIAALGPQLPEVARAYGLQPDKLVSLFEQQSDLAVDPEGALLYVCEGLALSADVTILAAGSIKPASGTLSPQIVDGPQPVAGSTASVPVVADAETTTDIFRLHSLPGAQRVIYLDFDGHTTTGTQWNTAYVGGAPIVSAPFDLDGDPASFSDSERGLIKRIWARVAEDFAPFGVNVTTEDPGIEALRRTSTSDNAYGVRVVISPSNWYKVTAGGVAYIGSYNWNSDTPCWVFTGQLSNNEKAIAEATSHETGHTLGLHHNGTTTGTAYYMGHGDWAPIMGNSYYRPVTHWCRGEYANANNKEDQIVIMANYGVATTADDHGDSPATATVLYGSNIADGGTIETRTDVDMFRLDAGAGSLSLTIASAPSPEPNLNLQADLLNAQGTVLQASGLSGLGATISATVPAGTYYLRIKGIGSGDPLGTGYSNYASLGTYVITGTMVPASPDSQPPTAVISTTGTAGTANFAVSFSGQNSTNPSGGTLIYSWNFGDGTSSGVANPTYIYTTPGTYVASLTVTGSTGLSSTASVVISVAAPQIQQPLQSPNQLPVAVASGTPITGYAPLPVVFSSSGSVDSDGMISAYYWEFGDGTTSGAASPAKTYGAPGNYTARLTVTDDRGGTASATVSVTVLADVNTDSDFSQFTLGSFTERSGTTPVATVVIRDRLGRPVSGATVTVQWSGFVSGNSTGTTDSTGTVVLTGPRSKKSGTVTATITTVMPSAGLKYDPAIYSEPTVRSIGLN